MPSKKTIESVNIKDIKADLESRIDTTKPVEMEKVERYINYIESYRRMNQIVKEEGESQITENATQRFVKAHPLLAEMSKINTSILNVERSFNFIQKEDDYTSEDLI